MPQLSEVDQVAKLSVLVIGGTSFFGKAIVEHLLDAGHEVSVFSRGQHKPDFFSNITHIQGDRGSDFSEKLKGKTYDAVIDNIAYTANDVAQAIEVFKGNVGRYVFTSTGAMYFTGSMTMPVTEDDVDFAYQPSDAEKDLPLWTYTMGKLGGEKTLHGQSDVPFVIVRPPVVLGPEDVTLRGYFYFQRLLDGKPLIVTNGGVQSFRLVYSQDLARGYLLTLNNDAALGQTYNLTQKESVRLMDLLKQTANALDVEPNFVSVPNDVLRAKDFDYPEPYAGMTNFLPAIRKAETELGYTTTPFNDWLNETAIWYRDHYQGEDSANYKKRDEEVKLAQWYQGLFNSA